MAGKGSRPRPYSVDQKTFDSNWDAIFSKNKQSTEQQFDEKVVMKEEYYDEEDLNDPDRVGN